MDLIPENLFSNTQAEVDKKVGIRSLNEHRFKTMLCSMFRYEMDSDCSVSDIWNSAVDDRLINLPYFEEFHIRWERTQIHAALSSKSAFNSFVKTLEEADFAGDGTAYVITFDSTVTGKDSIHVVVSVNQLADLQLHLQRMTHVDTYVKHNQQINKYVLVTKLDRFLL